MTKPTKKGSDPVCLCQWWERQALGDILLICSRCHFEIFWLSPVGEPTRAVLFRYKKTLLVLIWSIIPSQQKVHWVLEDYIDAYDNAGNALCCWKKRKIQMKGSLWWLAWLMDYNSTLAIY